MINKIWCDVKYFCCLLHSQVRVYVAWNATSHPFAVKYFGYPEVLVGSNNWILGIGISRCWSWMFGSEMLLCLGQLPRARPTAHSTMVTGNHNILGECLQSVAAVLANQRLPLASNLCILLEVTPFAVNSGLQQYRESKKFEVPVPPGSTLIKTAIYHSDPLRSFPWYCFVQELLIGKNLHNPFKETGSWRRRPQYLPNWRYACTNRKVSSTLFFSLKKKKKENS